MAAKLRQRHQEEVRQRIKVAQLINFLQAYALTGKDTGRQEVNPGRVQAAKILLDKAIANPPQIIEGAGENGSHVFELKAPWIESIAKARGWA